MAMLENSKRRLPQAVYAQVRLRDKGKPFIPNRPFIKWGLIAAGRPTREEVLEIKQRLAKDLSSPGIGDGLALKAALGALNTIEPSLFQLGGPDCSRIAPLMAQVDSPSLAILANRLITIREEQARKAVDTHKRMVDAYRRSCPTNARPVQTQYQTTALVGSPTGTKQSDDDQDDGQSSPDEGMFTLAHDAVAESRPAVESLTLESLANWAITSGWDAAEAKLIKEIAQDTSHASQVLTAADYPMALEEQLDHSVNVLTAFSKQMDVEPVGFLHLERLTFAPDGIERGELVYSIPLAPGEEVNIAHKEWATTAEEFQRIVTDSLEQFSEEGVTEKSELSQSTTSQQHHSNGFNTGVTASGGYGPVSITSSLGVSIADSATSTEEFSRNQSIAVTRKASSRSKKEHKISFKVASASGTEDQSIRRIKNPFPDKATRVDYYQLIRKWEVNVYRYGIRLTYDITIPEPGSDVLAKIKEINDLNAALQQGFGSDSSLPWAKFTLLPKEISRDNYANQAAKYNAAVPSPPVEFKWYDVVGTHAWGSFDESKHGNYFTLQIDVPEEYAVDQVSVVWGKRFWKDEEAGKLDIESHKDFSGTSGKRILRYYCLRLSSASVELKARAKLRSAAFQEWQLKAWNAMRDAAQARYYEQRSLLTDRLAKLTEELGAQDALSLRKFEREEVMKGVLRWLFGPDFDFVPIGVSADLYAKDEAVVSAKQWKEVLRHGELIKFLHHAIEWENVLYFLYPYFWSHVSNWELKKYLDHPDPMHRAFLKAGSARVVLTIRPGFERDFVSFLEQGTFDGLSSDHPYMSIIEEMENYAKTNYPGIPPANPEETISKEQGLLIGTWHEYTPTSALDIAFGETMPTA